MLLPIEPVQQQTGGIDCGLFAIVYITSLLNGQDPSLMQYHQPSLRPHLLKCLRQERMTPFPSTSQQSIKQFTKQQFNVELYCGCHMPWDPVDSRKKSYQMACCDNCSNWFHRVGENIPDAVFTSDTAWKCFNCLSFVLHQMQKMYYLVSAVFSRSQNLKLILLQLIVNATTAFSFLVTC